MNKLTPPKSNSFIQNPAFVANDDKHINEADIGYEFITMDMQKSLNEFYLRQLSSPSLGNTP